MAVIGQVTPSVTTAVGVCPASQAEGYRYRDWSTPFTSLLISTFAQVGVHVRNQYVGPGPVVVLHQPVLDRRIELSSTTLMTSPGPGVRRVLDHQALGDAQPSQKN
eukprot:scaffold24247_cov19-Tisochrysis_lutea.AAC.1